MKKFALTVLALACLALPVKACGTYATPALFVPFTPTITVQAYALPAVATCPAVVPAVAPVCPVAAAAVVPSVDLAPYATPAVGFAATYGGYGYGAFANNVFVRQRFFVNHGFYGHDVFRARFVGGHAVGVSVGGGVSVNVAAAGARKVVVRQNRRATRVRVRR